MNGPMIPVKGWSEADGRSPLAADQLVGYQGAEEQKILTIQLLYPINRQDKIHKCRSPNN